MWGQEGWESEMNTSHQWVLRLSGKFHLNIRCNGFDAACQKIPDATFLLPPAQDRALSHFPPLLPAGLSGSFVSVPSDSFFQTHVLFWL